MSNRQSEALTFDTVPSLNVQIEARRASRRIVFDDFPDIWAMTDGDFHTIYQLDVLFVRGHEMGRRFVEAAFVEEGGTR